MHSECVTGDVFGSHRCDCGPQLKAALASIAETGGVLVYMRQEGRGIGLRNKVAAYALQDQGMDTLEANLHLGFDGDLRTYEVAAAMLRLVGVEAIKLWTNNPAKVEGLQACGLRVGERLPLSVGANATNASYLHTKRTKFGHLLKLDDSDG